MTDAGFSIDWLTLRTAADDRARAMPLLVEVAKWLGNAPARASTHAIVDLGAGTGATLRALAPHLPTPQRWTLVDADAVLLEEAQRRARAQPLGGVTVHTRLADLTATPAPWDEPPALVTASALFDLTSAAFVSRFAQACAADRIPVLAMLTYDGRLNASPAHPLDETMRAAFHRHQKGIKSFGPAAGPDGPQTLADAFLAHGYSVVAHDTPWVLEAPRDDAMIAATLSGWANAAAEMLPERAAAVADWHSARAADTVALTVGHQDQLFIPPQR